MRHFAPIPFRALAAVAIAAVALAPFAAAGARAQATPAAAPAAAEKRPGDAPVSLRECILMAVKGNPALAADVLEPEMADMDVRLAGEAFLPRVTFDLTRQSTNEASFSWINAAESISQSYNSSGATLTQFLPTGGRLRLGLAVDSTDTTQKFMTINPRYGSEVSFAFEQPLLRGLGPTPARYEILVARKDRDISDSRFRAALVDLVTSVEVAYWNLVYAVQDLDARRESLRWARDLLAKNESELKAGVIAPIDLLTARSEVAAREADILQSETAVRVREEELRTLVNPPAAPGSAPGRLVPADRPGVEPRTVDPEAAIQAALANRPDLEEARAAVAANDIHLGVARNALLPNVSLNASYWSPGVSGTQILYQDNNPLTGIIIGKVAGGSSTALKDALNFRYRNWQVSLSVDLPLDTAFSRARYGRARLARRSAALRLEDLERKARLDVTTAALTVESDYKRILAFKAARELAEETLRAEEKRLAAGMSTSYTVLQMQRDLATARSNEIRATTDYGASIARLEKAQGTTLRTRGIAVEDVPIR